MPENESDRLQDWRAMSLQIQQEMEGLKEGDISDVEESIEKFSQIAEDVTEKLAEVDKEIEADDGIKEDIINEAAEDFLEKYGEPENVLQSMYMELGDAFNEGDVDAESDKEIDAQDFEAEYEQSEDVFEDGSIDREFTSDDFGPDERDNMSETDFDKWADNPDEGDFSDDGSDEREAEPSGWDDFDEDYSSGSDYQSIMKNLKRIISMLIAVVIVMTSLPFEIFAADTAYAYVSDVQVTSQEDGMAPFDNGDTPGNDSGNHNNIVRSFDDVSYKIAFTATALSPTEKYTKFVVQIKVELDADITQAIFDTSYMNKSNADAPMAWVDKFTLEYFDKDGNSLGVGVNAKPTYNANAHNTGSMAGENSYRTPVTKQVITLERELGDGVTSFSSITRELEVFISVKAAMNGTTFQPKFSVNVENNEKNVDRGGNPFNNTITTDKLTVSAVGNYDVYLNRGGNAQRNWYDLENDKLYSTFLGYMGFDAVEHPDEAVPAYGSRPAILWSMYGQSDNPAIITQKGIKGCELPVGEARIKIASSASVASTSNSKFIQGYIKPTVWDHGYNLNYNLNKIPTDTDYTIEGAFGRDVGFLTTSTAKKYEIANGVVPLSVTNPLDYSKGENLGTRRPKTNNYGDSNKHSVYDSGLVETTFSQDIAFDMNIYDNVEDATIYDEIIFSDYNIDLNSWIFPINAYNSNTPYITADYTAGIASYQMFLATPTVLNENRYTTITTKVVDAEIHSVSGTTISSQAVTTNDINMMANVEKQGVGFSQGNCWENYERMKKISKNGTDHAFFATNGSDKELPLSVSGKWITNYDAGTYAGNKVYATTYFQMDLGTDIVTDWNILQLLDTKGVTMLFDEPVLWSMFGNPSGTDCDYKTLYVADPLFPEGYDTDSRSVEKRMNAVTEEDLIYFESVKELEDAGWVCVGMLHEFRNAHCYCKRYGGNTISVSIPCKLTDDFSAVGSTYGLVGKCRVWTDNKMKDISWADGALNYLTVNDDIESLKVPMTKSQLSKHTNSFENYTNVASPDGVFEYTVDNHVENYNYSMLWYRYPEFGTKPNLTRNSNAFQKSRYVDETITSGIGYADHGNTIMIIGYKTNTKISVNSKRYDLDKGQRIVKVTVSGQQTNTVGAEMTSGWKFEEHRDNISSTITLPNDLTFRENTISIQGQRISTNPDKPTLINYNCEAQGKTYSVSSYCYCEVNGNTLTVHYPDAYVPATLPDVEFETQISPFIDNNTAFSITTGITGDGCAPNGKATATASFSTTVLASTSVFKDVDMSQIEIGGDIVYTVEYDNLSLSEQSDVWLYDVLPYNGDNRGSDFNGSFEIVDIWSDSNASFTYYTTADDPESIANDMAVSWSNWDKYFSTENQIVDNATAIFVKMENVASYDSFALKIKIRTSDNKGGDTYDNNAYIWETSKSDNAQLTTNVVETKVLSRSVEGFCWIDTNEDGDFSDTEKKLGGITVTLLQKRDNEWLPAKDVEGRDVPSATTDENGAYRFNNLAAGDYIIVFDGNFDNFIGATQYISGNNGLNNKAVTSEIEGHQYQTKFTSSQTEIVLPEADEMISAEYVLSGMNLGVVEPEIKLPSSGVDWMIVIMSVGLAVIVIGLLASKKNLKSKPRLS